MSPSDKDALAGNRPGPGTFIILLSLCVVLGFLFRGVLIPQNIHFSNDGPLGAQSAQAVQLPEAFLGVWHDLNSLGINAGSYPPGITQTVIWLLGPLGLAKVYPAFTLLILGIGAWVFFKQNGLTPIACLLGGLAAALNSGFFSAACWGVGGHCITIGMTFLALAALTDMSSGKRWIRVALAGFCVGMVITEGADIGAIFSLFVAAFVLYQAWTSDGSKAANLVVGVGRVAVVAVLAAFLAAQFLAIMISTQIKGVAGTGQDSRTKAERWDWATQWSLPKREALGLVVPGLFGYRMDTPNGGNYWGAVGRDPAWDRYYAGGEQGPPPGGFMRFSGGGIYAGVLVVMVAFWAFLQSLRKEDSAFDPQTRRWLWFWSGVAALSLLLAFGRFAPFYQFLYALPYFSTIRNPAKFTHVLNWAVVILFAHGVHGLSRKYMERAAVSSSIGAWWRRVSGFDRRWTLGCVALLALSLVGWLMYASNRPGLEQYLQKVQFDADTAQAIAGFSIRQVGWFVMFLAAAAGLILLVLAGAFSGPRAKLGAAALGLLLVVDLGRANQPWIVTWDYTRKYATNPIIDFLREKPYEHRVAMLPFRAPPEVGLLGDLYRIEWAQHHFLYYNIQSLDVVQMSRVPQDLEAFEQALHFDSSTNTLHRVTRRWQLTNTRYLLGPAMFLELLNGQLDPVQRRFRIARGFEVVPKPGVERVTKLEEVTAIPAANGNYAVFEFTGALPRASLYGNWRVSGDDTATLREIAEPAFDPAKTVLLAEGPASPPPAEAGAANPGTVEFASYSPKHIALKARVSAPSVLLLNDRYDPNWRVYVDGKPERLLRCNYIMRGVHLTPGDHQVEFKFEPPIGTLYVSLAALAIALALCGVLVVWKDPAEPPSAPDPEAKSKSPNPARGK